MTDNRDHVLSQESFDKYVEWPQELLHNQRQVIESVNALALHLGGLLERYVEPLRGDLNHTTMDYWFDLVSPEKNLRGRIPDHVLDGVVVYQSAIDKWYSALIKYRATDITGEHHKAALHRLEQSKETLREAREVLEEAFFSCAV